jgi:SPP1 family predicted phage head-tail adaptor
MFAGKLRHRVRLQDEVETPDGAGGLTSVWTDIATFWAEVLTTAGRELTQARQSTPTLSHMVRCRYRRDITADMRLVYNEGVLRIAAPPQDPDGRQRELIILCEAIVGEVEA